MSLDDFYLTSAGLAAVETTLFVYNKDLYKDSEPTGYAQSLRSSQHKDRFRDVNEALPNHTLSVEIRNYTWPQKGSIALLAYSVGLYRIVL